MPPVYRNQNNLNFKPAKKVYAASKFQELKEEYPVGKILGLGGSVLAALFFFVILVAGCNNISPGNVGVVISKTGSSRGVQDVAIKTGWVLADPITTSVIEYPVYVQTVKWTKSADEGKEADESITFTSKDSMIINADISLSYELNQDKVPNFYVKFRADKIETFTDGYLRNVVRDTFNEQAGQYSVEDIMGDNGDLLKKVRASVQSQLEAYGVKIDQLGFIGAPRPPQGVLNSINLKVQAQQIALQKQNEVAQAEADAKSAVARAEGEAKASVARAQGQAEANRDLAGSLSDNLINWQKVQNEHDAIWRWNGVRPTTEVNGGGQNGPGVLLSVPTH
jgi:regulator of protease activity HflC (stomatin/prohibitin superfamily)